MNAGIHRVEDIFLEKINNLCGKFGLNNVMAQLYAILYLHGKPMSLDDMADRLKMSKGSISVNIRALERYGAVRKILVRGSRRDYYEAEPDISKVLMDRVRSMARSRLEEVDDMITSSSRALEAIGPDSGTEDGSIDVFKERIEHVRSLYAKAKSLFSLMDSDVISSVVGQGTFEAESKDHDAVAASGETVVKR